MLVCPSCQMKFSSQGLLYKHQSKFCVGNNSPRRLQPYEDDYGYESPRGGYESPRRKYDNANRRRQLEMDAEKSGRALDEYKLRQKELQAQKQEIDKRLHKIQSSPSPDPGITNEIRQQENRNQKQLDELRRQLHNIKAGSENSATSSQELCHRVDNYTNNTGESNEKEDSLIICKPQNVHLESDILAHIKHIQRMMNLYDDDSAAASSVSQMALASSSTHSKAHFKDVIQAGPPTSGSDILPEIITMRQAYLRQGGTNPTILSHMAELESEARNIEMRGGTEHTRNRPSNKISELNDQLVAFELENQRLQNELLILQEKNNHGLRHVRDRQYAAQEQQENKQKEREYLQRLADLEHEMEVAKKQAQLERLRKELEAERAQDAEVRPVYKHPTTARMDADVPQLLSTRSAFLDTDPLLSAPYDERMGFVVFYDFAMGLEVTTQVVRLVTCLYNNVSQYGEPTVLPNVYCDTNSNENYYSFGANHAVIGAKQPVPRCPPKTDMALIIELQTASQAPSGAYFNPSRLSTKAWAKLNLFDLHGRLVSGRWRIPLRITPIKPHVTANDVNNMPQFGTAEIYLRVVNHRDSDTQTAVQLSPENNSRYTFPPQYPLHCPVTPVQVQQVQPSPKSPSPIPVQIDIDTNRTSITPENADQHYDDSYLLRQATIVPQLTDPPKPYTPRDFVPQSASLPPPSPDTIIPMQATPRKRPEFYDYPQTNTLGFQIDRVRFAEVGLGKIRLTAYQKSTGKIVQSATSPVTCSTTTVKSNFKYKYHVFGQQEAMFNEVAMHQDIIILARFYLMKQADYDGYNDEMKLDANDDESLAAWATIPLHIVRDSQTRVNVGTHILYLFVPPVPEPDEIPVTPHANAKQWRRYNGKASLRIHIFQGSPRPGSLTPSENSEDEDDTLPEFAWKPLQQKGFRNDPFNSTDGYDIYIDGCKHLPDNVTISRISGRCLNRKYEKSGPDVNCMVKLDSDVYNPVYQEKLEFREPNFPPSLTLLLKLYTIDKFYKKVMVMGQAAINIFVETGTNRQPKTDTGGMQISLNEGAHQIRFYAKGPNGVDPFSESTMKETYCREVPCATMLLRIVKAPVGRDGKPLEKDNFPQEDWRRMGLWQPMPRYTDGVYYSMKCKPKIGEVKLFQTLVKRASVAGKEAAQMIVPDDQRHTLKDDTSIENFIKTTLTKTMDDKPLDPDLTFIAQYSPLHGIKVAIDSANNLPWNNFTHATVCLNPPGAFYMGQAQAAYDKPKFTKNLVIEGGTNAAPEWKDPFFHFPNRSYHQYLTVIIHLQEISVSVSKDSYKYGLLEQAWTAIQVFKEGYACTDIFQLPLFYGPPKPHYLRGLAKMPCKNWVVTNVKNGTLKPVQWASVFLRLTDGRRDEETPAEVLGNQEVHIDTSYLPQSRKGLYEEEIPGKDLDALLPPGKSQHQFVANLATKFKSLVYKLYEESSSF